MKRKLFSLVAIMLVSILAIGMVGCSSKVENEAAEETESTETPVESTEVQEFALNHTSSLESSWQESAEAMAASINEDSGIKVNVFGNGTLVQKNWNIMLEMIQTGSTNMGIESATALGSIVPEISALQLPFLFDDVEHVQRFLDANPEIWQKWIDKFEEEDMVVLNVSPKSFRQLNNSKRLIVTPEDIAGLKFRVPNNETFVKLFELLGAKPVPMDSSEIYTAIQLGTVVGEDNAISNQYDFKTYEVAKNFTVWNYMADASLVVMNKDQFYALSPEQQEELRASAKVFGDKNVEIQDSYEVFAREEMEKAGTNFHDMTFEEKAPFKELVAPMYDSFKEQVGEEDYNKFMEAVDAAR